MQMERRGQKTRAGDLNWQIEARNAERSRLAQQRDRLTALIKREAARLTGAAQRLERAITDQFRQAAGRKGAALRSAWPSGHFALAFRYARWSPGDVGSGGTSGLSHLSRGTDHP